MTKTSNTQIFYHPQSCNPDTHRISKHSISWYSSFILMLLHKLMLCWIRDFNVFETSPSVLKLILKLILQSFECWSFCTVSLFSKFFLITPHPNSDPIPVAIIESLLGQCEGFGSRSLFSLPVFPRIFSDWSPPHNRLNFNFKKLQSRVSRLFYTFNHFQSPFCVELNLITRVLSKSIMCYQGNVYCSYCN